MSKDKMPLIPCPKELFDDEGYPSQEALDYINNWGFIEENGKLKFGEWFGKAEKYEDLIDFLKQIWAYDGLIYEDKLLELHTFGWSGNEDLIPNLQNTTMWTFGFRAKRVGGHYYFNLGNTEFTYDVIKVKND